MDDIVILLKKLKPEDETYTLTVTGITKLEGVEMVEALAAVYGPKSQDDIVLKKDGVVDNSWKDNV